MSSKTIAFIPIKSISKRVKNKNFRKIHEHNLYEYIITNAIAAKTFTKIYVDTDSKEIKAYAEGKKISIIDRPKHMTKDNVNGNDLLLYDYNQIKEGDYVFQLFATAPFLRPETIKKCVEGLKKNKAIDSVFTVTDENGWFWFRKKPINYRPEILPRSQDAEHVIKESTGLYGILPEALLKYKCRIGKKPKQIVIDRIEAIDLDTEEDFEYAEYMCEKYNLHKMVE